MSATAGYDPVTLNHWLWWKLRCHEGAPEDFQNLFEDVLKRHKPEFMQIRPYGNIGDRKCDGLYFHEGVVFQVYSPDELKQADVQAKIREDLAGAVKHWKRNGLKRWVFVYNCRRGLAPDIPGTLTAEKKKYPWLKIDPLSSDALWEMARELTLQQRCEILGAPLGYEHSFLLPNGMDEGATEQMRRGHFVVVHDVMSPINVHAALRAIEPARPLGPPFFVRPVLSTDVSGSEDWLGAAAQQGQIVAEALSRSRDLLPRFAVFSLAPIPLAMHLGFLFSDRVEVRAFQFDRDRCEWTWPNLDVAEEEQISTTGLPAEAIDEEVEVALRVSFSARVPEADALAAAPTAEHQVELGVSTPSVSWLNSDARLSAASKAIRETLSAIRAKFPRCRCLRVFAAVPTPIAVAFGQAVNPRMDPPVALYEYSRQRSPRYRYALTLKELP